MPLAYDLCDFYGACGFYSSLALKDMSRVPSQRLVDEGHLTEGEAHILRAIKMQGIQLDAGAGKPVRGPQCHTCGRPSAVNR